MFSSSRLPHLNTLLTLTDAYAPNASDRKNYLVSPLLAPSSLIAKLPPTFIDVCGADPLAGPALAYAKKLEENGVKVRTYEVKGMPHGSFILFPGVPSSLQAKEVYLGELKWTLGDD